MGKKIIQISMLGKNNNKQKYLNYIMPNFKPKAKKKILANKKEVISLDNKHSEKMKNFEYYETIKIPELEKRKSILKKKLKKVKTIDKKITIKDELMDINEKIKKLKLEKKDYLLDNSKHVFNYFEKKKNIGKQKSKKNILHSFFNKGNKVENKKDVTNADFENYLKNIDKNYVNIEQYKINYEKCNTPDCKGEMVSVDHKGTLICNGCGVRKAYLVEHEKPSYKEPPKEVCFYAYKRINHFREILAQFQAKETTQIPQKVIDDIKKQIEKERITLKDMSNVRAKDILKKLGYNKYYEHIPFIKDKLGIKPPIMSSDLEEKLCNLFMEIQKPYSKHCPQDRVNFLNYYYVLYKMCELLNEMHFLPFFPMLKDPMKRIEQDEIWKKICKDLNWQFYPTE
tara:strand:+ start:469 stop:1662 length:1194 start_codon:yes stop_codon:yes gene_type:complete